MPPSFENTVILITGAGSGIGRGTSIKLAQLGASLALTDINEASINETLELCTKRDHFTSAFDVEIVLKYGRINHIFNCAGINGIYRPTVDVTDAYWDKMFNTNITGFFNITRACIPHLKSGASFVSTTSAFGITPGAGYAVYLALELGPKGVRTNIIAPGAVRTPTNVQPDDIADVVAFLFSNESRYMNGSVVEVTGGFL
ncbi:NAD(P)-binding protein [Stipitochalara longipes BDJ]|nr:NAD(P)-binding protein [Stipitochalara longipes BDJ]